MLERSRNCVERTHVYHIPHFGVSLTSAGPASCLRVPFLKRQIPFSTDHCSSTFTPHATPHPLFTHATIRNETSSGKAYRQGLFEL